MSSPLPDCLYCRQDQRLHDLMLLVAPLAVSTLLLFREQTHPGRCVVAYRGHVNELFELPPAELTAFMQDVAQAARAIKAVTGAQKINYGAYSDKLAHLHFHLVPKYEGGPGWGSTFEMMPATKRLLDEAAYAAQIAALQAELRRARGAD